MTDPTDHGPRIGYCTNVHSGADWQHAWANLRRHAPAVKQRFSPDDPMGIGLWFSQASVAELLATDEGTQLGDWLRQSGLVPFTLNGFPQHDFHQPVVKHAVYRPDWREAPRLAYSCDLVRLLHRWLPAGAAGSISTVPLGWGRDWSPADLKLAAEGLLRMVEFLEDVEQRYDCLIHLDLEPEPGCVLHTADDVIAFFNTYLFPAGREARIRRYLRVCHDICHAAVMYEDQQQVVQRYQQAGIAIGKVQVSSAVRLDCRRLAPADRQAALDQLTSFVEPRYLHQTTIRDASGDVRFHEDLQHALAAEGAAPPAAAEWRVHFHVPVFLESFGRIDTTQTDIAACLQALTGRSEVSHFEVETYAWSVLPAALREPQLSSGIARELLWVRDLMQRIDR